MRKKSLADIANERVPFLAAAAWAGIGTGARDRGMKVSCPSCGESGAMRVYEGHGWCFAERRYFTPVSLLAEFWDMEPDDAAREALDRIGYVPVSYARLWENAQRDPEPAVDQLAEALRVWCSSACPDWQARQYDEAVARLLGRCLWWLREVHTEEDCRLWLAKCKEAMGRVLSASGGNSLTGVKL